MLRIILGIVGGVIAGFAAIWLTDMIGHSIYPIPSDVSIGNPEQMGALIRGMPGGAQAFVVAAWFAGALVGGIVANLIADQRWTAWVIAGFVALASILNILMIPHPEWMQISAVVAPVLGGLIAAHLARPRRRAGSPTAEGEADAGV